MTHANPQIPEKDQHYDDMMREIEDLNLTALFAVVLGSQLHRHLSQSGIDAIEEG